MKKFIALFKVPVFMAALLILFTALLSCGGANAKANKLKGTVWLEDYGVEGMASIWTSVPRPVMTFNKLEFDDKERMLTFSDDYGEYNKVTGKEFEIGKGGVITVYLESKTDVLPIKKKEPAKWLEMKKRLVLEGTIEKDTITFPSGRKGKDGKRVFTKSSKEDVEKISIEIKAEFDAKEAEYNKALEAIRENLY